MAWSTPATFTTGNVLTAAQMNTNVRDNTGFLHSPPGCVAARTTAQVIATGTVTTLSFNATDIYDTDSMHDPVGTPTTITFNTAGVYECFVSCQFAANGTGARWITLRVAGSSPEEIGGMKDTGPTSGVNSYMNAASRYKATAADSLVSDVQQTSGGNLSVTNSNATTLGGVNPVIWMGAQWVSDGT